MENKIKKFFTERQVYASAFFGGPIPPGILIYKNLKKIGDNQKANQALLWTFTFTVLLFYFVFKLPDEIADKIPNIAYTALYTVIVFIIYRRFLAEKINEEILEPENKASNWHVTGLTILGFLINIAIIFAFAFIQADFPGDKIEYGEAKHQIFFDEGTINEADIQTIGELLTECGYFNDETKESVRIEQAGIGYTLVIPFHKDYWYDPEILSELENLKAELSSRTGLMFTLQLLHYEISGDDLTKLI